MENSACHTKIHCKILRNALSLVFLVLLSMPDLVGQNNSSLYLAKESQHFQFYSTESDLEILDTLAITLEKNYARITNLFGLEINNKINVNVFPDVKDLHAAINMPDAPEWVVGTGYGNEIMLVSPLNPGRYHTYESLMQIIVHEFVHIAVYHVVGDLMAGIPRWLNEGYACYEAGQINDNIKKSLASGLLVKAPPTWTQLETASDMEFGQMGGYGYSATIVEFLIDTFGFDKLVLLIKEPEKIESIYGISKDALEAEWIKYLTNE